MPKREDLAKKLSGDRFVTQQKVETKDPMQQIMQAVQPAQPDVETQERTHEHVDASVPASMPARVHARTHVRKQTGTRKEVIPVEALYEKILNRKHLSSSTFRFQSEELQALEDIFSKLDGEKPGRLSRNDIARLGLIWLFEDFRLHGDESVLAQVHKRM